MAAQNKVLIYFYAVIPAHEIRHPGEGRDPVPSNPLKAK
jgi:hypothetical protein